MTKIKDRTIINSFCYGLKSRPIWYSTFELIKLIFNNENESTTELLEFQNGRKTCNSVQIERKRRE